MSKFSELKYKAVFVENQKIAEVRDAIIDTDEWKVTHLIVDLTKEAAKEILGSPKGMLNTLAVSALEKGAACCTPKGIEIKVSKGQLHISPPCIGFTPLFYDFPHTPFFHIKS